jgi:Zn-dependent oligopeptidase
MKIKNVLNFSFKKEEIIKETNNIITESKNFYNKLTKNNLDEITFDNIVKKISRNEAEFSTKKNNIQFLSFVSEDKIIRKASTDCSIELEKYKIEVNMRKDVYELLLKIKKDNLNDLEKKLLNKMIV